MHVCVAKNKQHTFYAFCKKFTDELCMNCFFIRIPNEEQRVRKRTLAPSAVATATPSLRASVHP